MYFACHVKCYCTEHEEFRRVLLGVDGVRVPASDWEFRRVLLGVDGVRVPASDWECLDLNDAFC